MKRNTHLVSVLFQRFPQSQRGGEHFIRLSVYFHMRNWTPSYTIMRICRSWKILQRINYLDCGSIFVATFMPACCRLHHVGWSYTVELALSSVFQPAVCLDGIGVREWINMQVCLLSVAIPFLHPDNDRKILGFFFNKRKSSEQTDNSNDYITNHPLRH